MVIDDQPNHLLLVLFINLNIIPTLYQRLLLLIVDILPLFMKKGLLIIHISIFVLENHTPMTLSLIIEDHIINLLIISIRIKAYLLLPLV